MVYKYCVTLQGLKGFAREYEINGNTTLYTLHKRLREDLEFPHDLLILFKALGGNGELVARYGEFDLGFGSIDEVSLEQTIEAGVASFVYFYDAENRKSVIITLSGLAENQNVSESNPVLVFTKGPVPSEFENGYVAFEDLPEDQRHPRLSSVSASDDDDFDEDDSSDEDEDDDREEEEIVYDGEDL